MFNKMRPLSVKYSNIYSQIKEQDFPWASAIVEGKT